MTKSAPRVSRRALTLGLAAVVAANVIPAPPKTKAAGAQIRAQQTPSVSAAMQELKPNRAMYNGTAGTGFSVATISKMTNQISGDTTMPKVGRPVLGQPEMGFLGRNTPVTNPTTNFTEGFVAPILHLVTDPITDIMVVGDKVFGFETLAAALDGIAGGVTRLEVYLENDTPTIVTAPTQGTIPYWGNTTKNHGLYQVLLKAASLNVGDEANMVAIGYPALSGLHPRVIGPYRISRRATWDSTFLVDKSRTGADDFSNPLSPIFKSLPNAINFYATNTTYPNAGANLWGSGGSTGPAVYVRGTFAQNANVANTTLDFSDSGTVFTDYTGNNAIMGRRGRFVLDATGSGWQVKNNLSYVTAFVYYPVDWVGWSIDIANISTWANGKAYTNQHHFGTMSQCEIISSNGMRETPGAYGVGSKAERGYQVFQSNVFFVGCHYGYCVVKDMYISKSVGCLFDFNSGDDCDIPGTPVSSGAYVLSPDGTTSVGYSFLCVGHTLNRVSVIYNNGYGSLQNAALISYNNPGHTGTWSIFGNDQVGVFRQNLRLAFTGASSVAATFDITGSSGNYVPNNGPRTLTLKENGTVKASFSYGQSYTNNGRTTVVYTFGDLVQAINDWAAGTGAAWAASFPTTTSNPLGSDANNLTSATFTGSVAYNASGSNQLAFSSGSVVGTAPSSLVGQMVFTTQGVPLATISSVSGSTITLAAKVITASTTFGVAPVYTKDNITNGTVMLFSKACTAVAPGGDILNQSIATLTASSVTGTGTKIFLNVTSITSGVIQRGQQLYRNDGATAWYAFADMNGNTGGVGTYRVNQNTSTLNAVNFTASAIIGYYDAKTFVLNVDGVPVKQFTASHYPTAGSPNGYYYIDDFTMGTNTLTPNVTNDLWLPLTPGQQCTGLVGAINAYGNGWSASMNDGSGNLLPGTDLALENMRTATVYAKSYTGVPQSTAFSANFQFVPLIDASSNPVYVMAAIGAHVDYGQVNVANHENVLMSGNLGYNMDCQVLIWGAFNDGTAFYNMAHVNCGIQLTQDTTDNRSIVGQPTSRHFHTLIVNCSFPSMTFVLRLGSPNNQPGYMDKYTRVDSNYFDALNGTQYNGSSELPNLDLVNQFFGQIKRNVMTNKYPVDPDFSDTGTMALNSSGNIAGNIYLYSATPPYANTSGGGAGLGYNGTNLTNHNQIDFPGLAYGLSPEFPSGFNSATVFNLGTTPNLPGDFKPAPNAAFPSAPPGLLRAANDNPVQIPHDALGVPRNTITNADMAGCIARAA